MSRARVDLGKRGEDLAAGELERSGYRIVDRNWRCRAGEVDIVARRDDAWVFFEVRTRRGTNFGAPEESVTPTKQERMSEVALEYLVEHEAKDPDWQLGFVAIEMDRAGQVLRIDVYDCFI